MLLGQTVLTRWAAPEGPWTEPDLHLFPQDGHRYEIVDGSLHVTPPQSGQHDAAVRALVTALRGAAPDGWWVCDRLGIAFAGHNLIPDVAVLRPQSSGATWAHPADVALVVEVESPATRRYDRLLKPALYAEAGIPGLWRVEATPSGPEVHEYALDPRDGYTHRRTLHGPDRIRLDAPYPVSLAAAALG